jgi:hypothetical protein
MKKLILGSMMLLACTFMFVECFNKTQKPVEKKEEIKLVTHKEAVDTMRADSNAPLRPIVFKALNSRQSYEWFRDNEISSLLKTNYPDNGFFGKDRYRIEFFIADIKRDSLNVNIYHVKGKNRHKKMITPFEGVIRFKDIASFSDPNLDNTVVENMAVENLFATSGDFEFREDSKAKFSGVFKGTIKMEFSKQTEVGEYAMSPYNLWYYSDQLPSEGAGYRFDGAWTSYTDANDTKEVIWAQDIFRFANNILKDFSYGERDVTINEAYRHLGWQEIFDMDEWWNDAKKPTM